MTVITPQTFGRTKTLIATSIGIGLLLLLFLLIQSGGDLANGILFFVSAISNIHAIIILSIIFGLSYLFGGMARKEIILEKNHFAWTAIKYSVLIMLSVIAYSGVIGVAKDGNWSPENFFNLTVLYFLTPLSRAGILGLIPLLIIWLWSTNQMRLLNSQEE